MKFDKEALLAEVKSQAEVQARNIENKAVAIQHLPEPILEAAQYVQTGIYRDVLANVTLEVETLSQAIVLMRTSNTLVPLVYAKGGGFSSFLTPDSEHLAKSYYREQNAKITEIQPYYLELDYSKHSGHRVSLRWYAEYAGHRYRFEARIKQINKLPYIHVEWETTYDRVQYIVSTTVKRVPSFQSGSARQGALYMKYANIQPDNVGNAIVYFARSENLPGEDFSALL